MASEDLTDRSLGELVRRLSDQTTTLVRQEIRLALSELQEKGKRAGVGAGLFGGTGLVALYAVGALIAGLILLLATALEAWLAAFIVAAGLGLLAGLLALTGKKQVERAVPPVPQQAVDSMRADVETVKERTGRT